MIIFVVSVGVLCILVSLMLTLLIVWMKEDDVKWELKKIYLLLDDKKEASENTLSNEASKEANEKDPK